MSEPANGTGAGHAAVTVMPVTSRADRSRFIELAYTLNRDDPNWVPPLRQEVHALLSPRKNPWFEHGTQQLFLALRHGEPVGRISAHIDHLAQVASPDVGLGPGTGNWGLLEAVDGHVAARLIATAEEWLRAKGMTRVLAPMSISIWDEPGLLTKGHDAPPTVMLGHNKAAYQPWVEAAGYQPARKLINYSVPIDKGFPDIVNRIVASGERSSRIRIRPVVKARFDDEAAIILGILNDAWSENWGTVPLTDSEIAHVGKKLKPLVFEDLIRIAEVDGKPVAFMIVLPDLNEQLITMNGQLFPLNWLRLLKWLRNPRPRTMRVPLMGVVKELQNSRMASQLAFMMIEDIRRVAVAKYGATMGDLGWVLDDNQGMIAVASAINGTINREYTVYQKTL